MAVQSVKELTVYKKAYRQAILIAMERTGNGHMLGFCPELWLHLFRRACRDDRAESGSG